MTLALGLIAAPFERPTTKDFVWDCWRSVKIGPIDFCFNFITLLLVLASVGMIVLFFFAFRRPRIVPGKFQLVMESAVEFVRGQIVMQMIGPEGMPFLPFLATLFFFILLGNILEVTPGISFPLNSRIAFPMVMALISWIVYNTVGIRRHGLFGYLKLVMFPPGAPAFMYVLLAPIEFISVILVRPLTLSVRLFANMVAGHFLLAVFFLGSIALLSVPQTFVFGVASSVLAIILVGFEIFVAGLQAFIFAVLTASYIGGAMAE